MTTAKAVVVRKFKQLMRKKRKDGTWFKGLSMGFQHGFSWAITALANESEHEFGSKHRAAEVKLLRFVLNNPGSFAKGHAKALRMRWSKKAFLDCLEHNVKHYENKKQQAKATKALAQYRREVGSAAY